MAILETFDERERAAAYVRELIAAEGSTDQPTSDDLEVAADRLRDAELAYMKAIHTTTVPLPGNEAEPS